jgi:tetratricopeptide (TPR) repeat protein
VEANMPFDDMVNSVFSNPVIIKHQVILAVAHQSWEVSISVFEKLSEPDGETHYFVSIAYAKLNQKSKANHHLCCSNELGYKPTMRAIDVCRRISGKTYLDEQNWESAIRKFREVGNPDAETHYYLAQACAELNQFDEATKYLLQAEDMGHPEAHEILEKMRRM